MDRDILNTPIKRISKLSIKSPNLISPNMYSDTHSNVNLTHSSSPDNLKSIMMGKGYSNKISDLVFDQMNKYIDIDDYESPNNSPNHHPNHHAQYQVPNLNEKFENLHNNSFSKMESIIDHYSISKKKRRTLTGIEESPIFDNSKLSRKSPIKEDIDMDRPSLPPGRVSGSNYNGSPEKLSSYSQTNGFGKISPNKTSPNKTSPSKISPSKKSFNLNEILTRKISYPKSKTPSPLKDKSNLTKYNNNAPSSKTAIPTLQSKSSIPMLHKPSQPNPSLSHNPSNSTTNKSSIPTLQHKSSIPTLQHKTSIPALSNKSSIPTLQHKTSIPTLQHKTSIPTLQHKTSIPTLQKKSSIPTLQHKTSIPSLQNKTSIPTLQNKTSIPTLQKKTSIPTLQKKTSISTSQQQTATKSHNSYYPTNFNSKANTSSSSKLFNGFVKPKSTVVKPITTFSNNSSNHPSNANTIGNQSTSTFGNINYNNDLFDRSLKRKSSNQSIKSINSTYNRPTFSSSKKCK